jgi:hypothetical protein
MGQSLRFPDDLLPMSWWGSGINEPTNQMLMIAKENAMATRIEERVLSGLDRRMVRMVLLIGLVVVGAVSAILILASNPGNGVAETDSIDGIINVDTFRWNAVGEFYSAQAAARQQAMVADAARWYAMGTVYTGQFQPQLLTNAAEAARWNAVGEFYQAKAEAREQANDALVSRWVALGEFYTAEAEVQAKVRQDAEVARWIAMGEFYAAQTELR